MINTYIVEDHNDALEYIYKEIGSKRLKISNLTMLHFDSHPDLGIPSNLLADDTFNKSRLLESISIENWILPAVYAGHINKLVWIKPHWSQQIKQGKYELTIGKQISSGLIKTNSTLGYFLSDDLYTNEANLTNKRKLELLVCEFDETIFSNQDLIELICDSSQQIILDVDLDFFSTRDPFKQMFSSSEDYDLFKCVYQHQLPEIDKLDFDSNYAKYMIEKQNKNDHILANLKSDVTTSNDIKLAKLKKAIEMNKIDLEILHNHGSDIDECSLPDHVSSNDEITSMMTMFSQFLVQHLDKIKPKCITVARSS